MRLYSFTVPEGIDPARLLPLTRRMLPELPGHVIREAFEKRDVKLDGVRAGRDAQVRGGETVRLYTAYEAETRRIECLYEDGELLVVFKPVGVSCEADAKGGKTIALWAGETLGRKSPESAPPLLCHRLDNQTDGLLLLAKNENAQSGMHAAFENRQIHKAYVCLVRGVPPERHGWLRAWLFKDAARGRVRVVNRPEPGALEILTEYEVMEAGAVSRLRITLHTGRTHQIRAQMAAIGHPLLGDDVYGDRAFSKAQRAKRLMLCATELWFSMEGRWAYMNDKHFTIAPLF